MHRSNFGRKPPPLRMALPAAKPAMPEMPEMKEHTPPPAVKDGAATRMFFNRAVSQIEDALSAQSLCMERLEDTMSKLIEALRGFNDKTDMDKKELIGAVSDLKRAFGEHGGGIRQAVAELGAGLKGHSANLASNLAKMLDHKGSFDGVRADLAKFNDVLGTQKGHSDMLSRLSLAGSKAKRDSEQKMNAIMAALADISDRLEAAAKKPAAKPAKKADSSVIDEIRAYMSAEKKVIRDSNGEIVGWKTGSSVH